MSAFVKFENVKKIYKTGEVEIPALHDVNFEIEKGEFVSLMGASGSGKSTLLYLIGGLDKPTNGEVYINDEDINKMKEKGCGRGICGSLRGLRYFVL